MQTFRDTATGKIWAFEDDVVARESAVGYSFYKASGAQLTQAPATLLPCVVPAPTTADEAAVAWQTYQTQARAAFAVAERVALRCVVLGLAFPAAWVAYAQALQAIVAASSGTVVSLPPAPALPAGVTP